MFIYSRAVLNKITEDIKRFSFIFSLLTQAVYVSYLIFALVSGVGIFFANIVLLTLSAAYAVLIVINRIEQQKHAKASTKALKKIYRRSKIAINAFTLGATLYGIFIAATAPGTASVILATFTTVMWMISILLEVALTAFEKYSELVTAALEKDIYQFKKWIPGTDAPDINERVNRKIETLGGAYESRLDAEKLLHKAQKRAKRQEKRKEIQSLITAKIKGILPKRKELTDTEDDGKGSSNSTADKK